MGRIGRKVRRRRKRAFDRAHLLSLIETGQPWEIPADESFLDFKLYELLTGHDHFGKGFAGDDDLRREVWGLIAPVFLKKHIEKQPGARPWAWWEYEAKKPRKSISGKARKKPNCPLWFGISESFTGNVQWEGQLSYLRRLRLLSKGEAKGAKALPEPLDPVTAFAKSAVAGEMVLGEKALWSCIRHLDDIEKAHERGYWLNLRKISRRLAFCRFIRHSQGEWAGQVFKPEPWQQFVYGSLWGWENAEGRRRFDRAGIWVARGNGKTFCGSECGWYHFAADSLPRSEVYSVATKKAQAQISHRGALAMRKASPVLQSFTRTVRDKIIRTDTDSFWIPLGKDADTEDGAAVDYVLADELHAWKTGDLWRVLRTAMGKRPEPIMMAISTAGTDLFNFGGEQYQYYCDIANPDIPVKEDRVFSWVSCIDSEGVEDALKELSSPQNWRKAHPNLGVSVRLPYLEELLREGLQNPSELNNVLVKMANIFVSQAERWLPMDAWARCAGTDDPVAWRVEMMEKLKGERCRAGLDIASVRDLTAFVLWFYDMEPQVVLPFCWVPRAKVDLSGAASARGSDKVPYDVWERQGFLSVTEGNVQDKRFILNEIVGDGGICERFHVEMVAYDPWGSDDYVIALAEHGVEVKKCRQGFQTMGAPTKAFEIAVARGEICHGGNPLFGWSASNATTDRDPHDNIKVIKPKDEKKKVDPIVAAIMAKWACAQQGKKPSRYETESPMLL